MRLSRNAAVLVATLTVALGGLSCADDTEGLVRLPVQVVHQGQTVGGQDVFFRAPPDNIINVMVGPDDVLVDGQLVTGIVIQDSAGNDLVTVGITLNDVALLAGNSCFGAQYDVTVTPGTNAEISVTLVCSADGADTGVNVQIVEICNGPRIVYGHSTSPPIAADTDADFAFQIEDNYGAANDLIVELQIWNNDAQVAGEGGSLNYNAGTGYYEGTFTATASGNQLYVNAQDPACTDGIGAEFFKNNFIWAPPN